MRPNSCRSTNWCPPTQVRIRESLELDREQTYMQPPEDSTDLITVIKGFIAAEDAAIAGYEKIIELCDKVDP